MAGKKDAVARARQEPYQDDEEEFDLAAFQASLDQSVSAAKSLVDSWIPSGFGDGGRSSTTVQTLKDRARPPRMGLGASPAAIHKQQAEDRKLKDRLLGKGRSGPLEDEGSTVKVDAPPGEATVTEGGPADDSDSDDEDSRSRAISKGKGKADASNSTSARHAPNNPFATKKANLKSTPRKSDAKATKPLFNEPSPTKPLVDGSTAHASESAKSGPSSTQTIAPVSFYPTTDAGARAQESGAALSKNQRKKLRKLEREQETKKRLQEESRKEEEIERAGTLKRAREDEGAEGDAEDVEMEAEGRTQSEPPTEADVEAGQGAQESQRKKKKKRKGKGKGSGESTAAPPLLNL